MASDPTPDADARQDADVSMDTVADVIASKHRIATLYRLCASPTTPSRIADATGFAIAHISAALTALRGRDLVELLVAGETKQGRICGVTDRGWAVARRASDVGASPGEFGLDVDLDADSDTGREPAPARDSAGDAPADTPRPDDFPKTDRRRVFVGQTVLDHHDDGSLTVSADGEVTGTIHDIERLLYEAECAAVDESVRANARRARALVVDVLTGGGDADGKGDGANHE